MNKYTFFGLLILYLVIVSFLVDASAIYSIDNGLETSLTVSSDATITGVIGMVGVFTRLLFFNVVGVPAWVTMIFIYPVVFVFWFMVVDVLKDLIPFT